MSAPFTLKDYQIQTLEALRDYFKLAGKMDSPNTAFYHKTNNPYLPAPQLEAIPYVCLRVPTGGGKTLLAAHSVGIAATDWMKTDKPTVIWFTPSQTIRDQTLNSLRDRNHPTRRALSDRFGENVRIMDVNEALYAKRADYDGGAVIIVATIQAFRVDNKEGRKVYESNGELMDHFTEIPPELRPFLERGDRGEIAYSLANVFRLRRPLIIADEAHNMSTSLSFDTLGRLSPSAIVEFTATPTTHAEHNPARGKFASNVLYHVSAAELKAADMIKLPVVLRGRADARETIADAIGGLHQLQDKAQQELSTTGEFIRPVMLLQAEARSSTQETLHAEKLKTVLIKDFRVPESEIALATGDARELDDVNLFDPDCPITFIITQQALKEGWDCSFAYVLCSVSNQRSVRSVEQLLGRVLRLPRASRKRDEDLNCAYAYATTTNFREAAESLRDSLIANGFEKIEADQLVKAPFGFSGMEEGRADYIFEEEIPAALDVAPVKDKIEAVTRGRVSVDLENNKISVRGSITDYERKHLEMVWPEGGAVLTRLTYKSRSVRLGPPDEEREIIEFSVPALAVRSGNQILPFDKSVYLEEPWQLERYDASKILDHFVPVSESDEAKIDVEKEGRIEIKFDRMANIPGLLTEQGWSREKLVNWLDKKIPLDERRDIKLVSSRLFIDKALDAVAQARKFEQEQLTRAKFHILDALLKTVQSHRKVRETEAWNGALFGPNALEVELSSDELFFFNSKDEREYGPNKLYTGQLFQKHLFKIVGDLKSEGEEYDCARFLDHCADVKVWLRNLDRRQNSFWLQTASDKFYPDFIALLNDGRVLVVEYKGEAYATNDDSREKEKLGKLWADASDGKCLFVMCVNRQFGMIQREIEKRS
jgi:type III restriction enzyme